jgi:hypothetical protein
VKSHSVELDTTASITLFPTNNYLCKINCVTFVMDNLIVTTEQGKLRGSTDVDFSGRKYLKFQGIPYGKPPIGELRFKVFYYFSIKVKRQDLNCILNL